MTEDAKILDGHMHLPMAETEREDLAWLPPMSPAVAAAAGRRRERYECELSIPPAAAGRLAKRDCFGVAAAVFLALVPRPRRFDGS
jgi:hypothetical protein